LEYDVLVIPVINISKCSKMEVKTLTIGKRLLFLILCHDHIFHHYVL
jgi:hypothetical protein